ncbi:F-box/kelch-repeat protein At3g06240 [Arachis ipaensis]|uniref:F-box/kelch-repeat protein At3g06240 n=1 Tax=Arachis ipaensis TaxID=130454 RepID=UPI0007AFA649|nr:F-box/kelch-repeat protein At3g06240 [Arachis ipaensis]XP_025628679.1 F-box/kelch-repeat protein At3g06240 [Arachis hypogaea]
MEKKKQRSRGCRGAELGLATVHILDLPIHLLSEIIARLPASSVIRCASVCTSFRALVSDPRFRSLYVSRAPTSFLLLSRNSRLLCLHSWGSASFLIPHSSSSLASLKPAPDTKRNRNRNRDRNVSCPRSKSTTSSIFSAVDLKKDVDLVLVNSSEGLVCLRGSGCVYYVCNPLLGEILELPPPPTTTTSCIGFSSFGYDPHSNRYKILQFAAHSVAELYSVGDKAWTTIRSAFALATPRPNASFHHSLNGSLHWLAQPTNTHLCQLICSFDLHTNEFKWVPPPSYFDAQYIHSLSGITLGVLKGCLCLCFVVPGAARFETWFMRDYGVQRSWSLSFYIDINSYCGLRIPDLHRPIAFADNGDMWLKDDSASDSYSLVSYSPQTGSFKLIHTPKISAFAIESEHPAHCQWALLCYMVDNAKFDVEYLIIVVYSLNFGAVDSSSVFCQTLDLVFKH